MSNWRARSVVTMKRLLDFAMHYGREVERPSLELALQIARPGML